MKTEIPTFDDLLEQNMQQSGKLFNSKLESFLLQKGGHFYCYACTHVKPMAEHGKHVGDRDYCYECYTRIKGEPKIKFVEDKE